MVVNDPHEHLRVHQPELLLGEADHVEGQQALRGLAAQPLSAQARIPDGQPVALAQRAVYQAEPAQYLALGIKQDVVTQNTDEGAGGFFLTGVEIDSFGSIP